MPELVTESVDGYKQIRFSDLPIYLLQAIKEMWMVVKGNQERISELENRINTLESQLQIHNSSSGQNDNVDNANEPSDEDQNANISEDGNGTVSEGVTEVTSESDDLTNEVSGDDVVTAELVSVGEVEGN